MNEMNKGSYGQRANSICMGENSVWEALSVRGFEITRRELFDRELTDFIAKMIDTDIIEDKWRDES